MVLFLMLFSTLNAATVEILSRAYSGYIGLSALFVIFFLIYLLIKYKKALKKNAALIAEKDEKIKWLREIGAQNEHRRMMKEQELEKRVIELSHSIEILEQKAKEGSKNQILMKIEALQNKRDRVLQRTGLDR